MSVAKYSIYTLCSKRLHITFPLTTIISQSSTFSTHTIHTRRRTGLNLLQPSSGGSRRNWLVFMAAVVFQCWRNAVLPVVSDQRMESTRQEPFSSSRKQDQSSKRSEETCRENHIEYRISKNKCSWSFTGRFMSRLHISMMRSVHVHYRLLLLNNPSYWVFFFL